MRRFLALAVSLVALAVAGCGGGGDSDGPLDEALGYLPKDAPFAVAIDTNLKGDQYQALGRLAGKFPFGGQLERQLEQQIERGGNVNFDKDVRPLLGNPFVVGAVNARSFAGDRSSDQFVGAIKAKDGGKLEDFVRKEGAEEDGEKNGAKLYRGDDGDSFAIKDDVLIVAGTKQVLEGALEQRERDDRLDKETFDKALRGLPEKSLLRVYSDVGGLIQADPDARQARRVDWVAALRTLGLTASAANDGISIDFKLHTDGRELQEEDLPIAAGDEAPEIVRRPGELGIGLRDPSQIVDFAQAAGQAVDPAGFGQFQAAKVQIERRLGVDIDRDIVDQLTGDVSVNVAPNGRFGLRAELKDPAAFERTLRRVADTLPRVAQSLGAGTVGLAKPKRGGDFYALAQPDGDSIVFGVVHRALVVSNEPARASRLGSETPSDVSAASGSLVVDADARRLAESLLRQLAPQIGLGGSLGAQLFTGSLDELTGWVSADSDGIDGKLKLEIR
jgi:uncharacterized protein DUF3352